MYSPTLPPHLVLPERGKVQSMLTTPFPQCHFSVRSGHYHWSNPHPYPSKYSLSHPYSLSQAQHIAKTNHIRKPVHQSLQHKFPYTLPTSTPLHDDNNMTDRIRPSPYGTQYRSLCRPPTQHDMLTPSPSGKSDTLVPDLP